MRFIDKEPLQMKEYIVHGGGTSAIHPNPKDQTQHAQGLW